MFKTYRKACNLPDLWDEIAGENPFLKRDILSKLDGLNPCSQTYHLNEEKKIALVSYRLKLDMFTFSKHISFKVPLNVIGIPMSVSKCGYSIVDKNKLDDLSEYIKSLKDFHVILNSDDNLMLARGNTLPTYKLPLEWSTMDEYILTMRSHYRYRIKKAIKKFKGVKIEELEDNNLFGQDMYRLYCRVYENSSEKLEKLSIDFFRKFPSRIIKFTVNNEAIAFIQLVERGKELIFLFGGFNHSLNGRYDLYINLLLEIIRYGIENGFKYIDLGQTAGETKSKLGGIQHNKYMYVHHSNKIINFILNKLVDKFSYNQYHVSHNVFKEEEDEGSIS